MYGSVLQERNDTVQVPGAEDGQLSSKHAFTINLQSWISLLILCLCISLQAEAQPEYANHGVFILGNICDVVDPVVYAEDLLVLFDNPDQNKTLILTGDLTNPDNDLQIEIERLTQFLLALQGEDLRIVLMSGDRDWDNSGPAGFERQLEIEKAVRALKKDNIIWAIKSGCPGPEKLSLDFTLSLIVMNTQWWNHPHIRPTPESAECNIASPEEAMEKLRDLLEDQTFGNIIIAGHFPIFSNGRYGGKYPLTEWLLPVPGISTMQTAYHQNVGDPEDLSNERYSLCREEMQDLLLDQTGLIYASGHEFSREILTSGRNYFINSGLPGSRGYVRRGNGQIFASREPGLIALYYEANGTIWSMAYEYREHRFEEEETRILFNMPCEDPPRDIPVNERLVPCLQDKFVLTHMQNQYSPYLTEIANPRYAAGGFKRFLLGQHYRKSWTEPIRVRVLDLDTVHGGLIPFQIGGGRQTNSLKLRDEIGYEYVFRSVDKDPKKALSHDLHETLIALAVQDQTTTQQPYGALAVSKMLDHLDILHPEPELYILPDDTKLGPFRETFGGLLGMLEDRPTGEKYLQPTFADAEEIKRTVSVFRELYKDRDNRIEANEFVRARIFDMMIGDWGKHEDNWKWAGFKQEKGMLYRPIPRDRDHAFSLWDGFIPWVADREWAKPSGEHFGHSIKGLRSLMWQARHLDRFLANEMERSDWLNEARFVREKMSNAVIEDAIGQMPVEILVGDGLDIMEKLKSRRDQLPIYADKYYRILAREVDVVGSVKHELFEAMYDHAGNLDVRMYKIRKGEKDKLFYHRTFYPDETREVRLFGLRGDDVFRVIGESGHTPLLRIIPGTGNDVIDDRSSIRGRGRNTKVYSLGTEDSIMSEGETRLMHIPWDEAYHYRRTAFAYNTYFPSILLFYSPENGLQAGGGVTFINQRYGKPDFSSIQELRFKVSTIGNVSFNYDLTLRHVAGAWDLVGNAIVNKHGNFNYFFGLGNAGGYDKGLFNSGFYTLKYSYGGIGLGLQREFWRASRFTMGLSLRNFSRETGIDNIIDKDSSVPGANRELIIKSKTELELDLRDNAHFPTQGMRLFVSGFVAESLITELDHYGRAEAFVEFFNSFGPVTLGLRTGYAHHFDRAPYYDLFYLGQNTCLRGYLQNRFAGDAVAFFNSDIRFQLIKKRNALIPYKLGLSVFCDLGRVYLKDEGLNELLIGYGSGLYFIPVRNRYVTKLSVGFSEEERGLIQLGFGRVF